MKVGSLKERAKSGPRTHFIEGSIKGHSGGHSLKTPLRIDYDQDADAAYIYLVDEMPPVAKTYPCDPVAVQGMINLDFDATGRLLGIEIMGASKKLSRELLLTAHRIDRLPREDSKGQLNN